MVLWDLILDAENAPASKIVAETVKALDLPCLSITTPGLILIGIYGQERITQDRLRGKGASNLHRDFFILMGVCLFFNCFVMKLCAIKLVLKLFIRHLPTKTELFYCSCNTIDHIKNI